MEKVFKALLMVWYELSELVNRDIIITVLGIILICATGNYFIIVINNIIIRIILLLITLVVSFVWVLFYINYIELNEVR